MTYLMRSDGTGFVAGNDCFNDTNLRLCRRYGLLIYLPGLERE